MTSNINEIVAPVTEQLRNPSSSEVSKRIRAAINQRSNAVKPSPGGQQRVEKDNGNEKPSREAVEKTLVKVNELAKSLSRKLSFSYDDRIDKIIVKVMEGDGKKIVRQIPPEEMIRLSLKMDEIMGMLINQNV
jgi:flagellar protein FlaG